MSNVFAINEHCYYISSPKTVQFLREIILEDTRSSTEKFFRMNKNSGLKLLSEWSYFSVPIILVILFTFLAIMLVLTFLIHFFKKLPLGKEQYHFQRTKIKYHRNYAFLLLPSNTQLYFFLLRKILIRTSCLINCFWP